MKEARMRALEILTGALLAAALPAAAAPLDDAKRILDATAPMQCELLKLHVQARSGSLAQDAQQRSAAIEQALAPDAQSFEAALALLNGPQHDELVAHAVTLMKACASQVERETGLRVPVQPAAAQPKLKVAPYAPVEKAVGVQGGGPAALQSQDPQ
jgi:hypothetical protein